MAVKTDAFEVDGFVQQRKELERLLMSNPAMEKKVQGLIRKVLLAVRREIGQSARGAMRSDPRQAYKAVKSSVYRQILGGSVSILPKRRARMGGSYEPPRKLRDGQRGGNRLPRSQRTVDLQSYWGGDRAFVLRFINAGTSDRVSRFGYRGRISARNFFSISSVRAMNRAAADLSGLIDDLIKKELS